LHRHCTESRPQRQHDAGCAPSRIEICEFKDHTNNAALKARRNERLSYATPHMARLLTAVVSDAMSPIVPSAVLTGFLQSSTNAFRFVYVQPVSVGRCF
jgi:hypothetical protein